MSDTTEIARESIEKLNIREQAEKLGCSFGAMQYIIYLEGRIEYLEKQVGVLLEHSDAAYLQIKGF